MLFSNPRTDGPRTFERELPGEAGELLRGAFYKARVVVERIDGGAIEPSDSEFVEMVLRALGEVDTHGEIRHQVASDHFRAALPSRTSNDDAAE